MRQAAGNTAASAVLMRRHAPFLDRYGPVRKSTCPNTSILQRPTVIKRRIERAVPTYLLPESSCSCWLPALHRCMVVVAGLTRVAVAQRPPPVPPIPSPDAQQVTPAPLLGLDIPVRFAAHVRPRGIPCRLLAAKDPEDRQGLLVILNGVNKNPRLVTVRSSGHGGPSKPSARCRATLTATRTTTKNAAPLASAARDTPGPGISAEGAR